MTDNQATTPTPTETPATPAIAPKPAAKVEVKTAAPAAKPAKAVVARAAKPARKPRRRKAVKAARPVIRKTRKLARAAIRKQGAMTMKTIDTGLFAADQFKTVFGDVNERAKAAAERSAKVVEELADLTRGNVEALVASQKTAAKGVEKLSQDAAEFGRKSFEQASATLKSFADVKSATELFRLQGDFARTAFDNAIAESARMSEAMLKLAGDIAEPITSRYTVAAERARTLAA